jgi:superfamily II DNA or RNA helicase
MGDEVAARLGEPLDRAATAQALRTALDPNGSWIPEVLTAAHTRLMEVRRDVPDAGGLVIASDQDSARAYAAVLAEITGAKPTVVLSDESTSSERIADFSAGMTPWMVAVRMVSEGVDIPRLRVGVYATTTATELFFRQAVGRLVRWTRGVPRQRAWLYIPDEPRLRTHAARIAEQRRHSLRRDVREQPEREEEPRERELPSEEVELTLAPPPPRPGGDGGTAVLTRREEKQQLREENAKVARELSRRTGLTHAQVNAELNRLSGVRRVSEATLEQLERRLAAGDRWLVKS